VESALERYDVPGVAIALIKDGQVAYQAGFGVRDKDDGRRRSPHSHGCSRRRSG
jgi:CubicO group peptidase (beta-lactamase class C family)